MAVQTVGVTFRFPKKAEPYLDALRKVNLEPVRITPEELKPIDELGGLLLTGGTDVDPILYGAQRTCGEDHPDRERDEMESALILETLSRDLPVFAICRGLQLWNVVAGGSLHQHIEGHRHANLLDAHDVEVKAGTRLSLVVKAERISVNSRHHQSVDRVGKGLVVSALAPDGTVEALESPQHRFAVAVQWHPEDAVDIHSHDAALFEAFSAEVRQFSRPL